MNIIDCEQGTDAWFEARLGRVTASRLSDVMANGRGGKPSVTRRNYCAQLVAERLSGTVAESYKSSDMDWGNLHEPDARKLYQFMRDIEVKQVGIIYHPSIDMTGASADGLVGDEGLIEIKCPKTATHIDTLLGGSIDGKYQKQMLWQMACTGRKWCDFVSYDPRMPPDMQLHIERVMRDDERIKEAEKAVQEFLKDVDEMEASLRSKYMDEAA